MKLIILAGMPATGKSTFAKQFRLHFGFPVLEKDSIKEALFDTVGFEGYPAKRQLDVASNEILLRMIRAMILADTPVIVDNNFDEESAAKLKALLEETGVNAVTVFLYGDPQVLYERYVARDSAGRRHLGHAMQTNYPPHPGESTAFHMTREGFDDRFVRRKMNNLTWGGAQIRVDATDPASVDTDALIAQVEKALI